MFSGDFQICNIDLICSSDVALVMKIENSEFKKFTTRNPIMVTVRNS